MQVNDTLANSYANDYAAALDSGASPAYVELYDGTPPAGGPNTAVTTQVLLGTCVCSATAGTVSGRVFTFNAITQDSSADNTGDPTWARAYNGDGVAKSDHTAGIAGSGPNGSDPGIVINAATINAGGPIQVVSGTVTF